MYGAPCRKKSIAPYQPNRKLFAGNKSLPKKHCYNCNQFGHISWQCTQSKNVARRVLCCKHAVHALTKQHPSKPNKILYETCQQLNAQADLNNLSNGSSSCSSCSSKENDNIDMEQNILVLLHSSTFNETERNEEHQTMNDS